MTPWLPQPQPARWRRICPAPSARCASSCTSVVSSSGMSALINTRVCGIFQASHQRILADGVALSAARRPCRRAPFVRRARVKRQLLRLSTIGQPKPMPSSFPSVLPASPGGALRESNHHVVWLSFGHANACPVEDVLRRLPLLIVLFTSPSSSKCRLAAALPLPRSCSRRFAPAAGRLLRFFVVSSRARSLSTVLAFRRLLPLLRFAVSRFLPVSS